MPSDLPFEFFPRAADFVKDPEEAKQLEARDRDLEDYLKRSKGGVGAMTFCYNPKTSFDITSGSTSSISWLPTIGVQGTLLVWSTMTFNNITAGSDLKVTTSLRVPVESIIGPSSTFSPVAHTWPASSTFTLANMVSCYRTVVDPQVTLRMQNLSNNSIHVSQVGFLGAFFPGAPTSSGLCWFTTS